MLPFYTPEKVGTATHSNITIFYLKAAKNATVKGIENSVDFLYDMAYVISETMKMQLTKSLKLYIMILANI